MATFSLVNDSRRPTPRVPFSKVARAVMGEHYSLGLIFTTPAKMKKLNAAYRKKDTSTDILAFPFSKTEGDIYISLPDVAKKAPLFSMTPPAYLKYLFVHGLVHLKGHDHGKKMDALEKKYCTAFKFPFPR